MLRKRDGWFVGTRRASGFGALGDSTQYFTSPINLN